jgi:hypothetical protein
LHRKAPINVALKLMARKLYCWRCKTEIPMLGEHEWERISPYLTNAVEQIKRYRETRHVSIAEAKVAGYGQESLKLYYEMTGFHVTNPDVLWHHRLSLLGAPCSCCSKPLRTPQAKLCAECGDSCSNSSLHTDAQARQ